uniref:Uncharacterized protein n=1 Tax=Rhizophora mucronata TaxID=61149 RepID=A0A2P2PKF3_RHIMU
MFISVRSQMISLTAILLV